MAQKNSDRSVVTARKLRTGEIAVWDEKNKTIFLISSPTKTDEAHTRVIRGATFKALEETLAGVNVLV